MYIYICKQKCVHVKKILTNVRKKKLDQPKIIHGDS